MRTKLDEDLRVTVLDGSTVVLDAKNGVYLGTNAVGTRMIELLRLHNDSERVITALLDEYDVSEDALRRDVHKLMGDLEARGLLTVIDAGATDAPRRDGSILKSLFRKFRRGEGSRRTSAS